jgi:hypothetical protein
MKDRPEIVGYDILNEPAPDNEPISNEPYSGNRRTEALKALANFNQRISAEIRKVDTKTPIIIEPAAYGAPEAVKDMIPLKDKNVIYSFHAYGPWDLVSLQANKGRFTYPSAKWQRSDIAKQFAEIAAWASRNKTPANRIYASEFGCNGMVVGCRPLLSDTLMEIQAKGWHWAFYLLEKTAGTAWTMNSVILRYPTATGRCPWQTKGKGFATPDG